VICSRFRTPVLVASLGPLATIVLLVVGPALFGERHHHHA
jgi:hypothetical protein